MLKVLSQELDSLLERVRDSWKDLTTDLVAVCLWSQPLVQRTQLSRQMLESIPEFSLLVRKKTKKTWTGSVWAGLFPHGATIGCVNATYGTSSGRSPCSRNLRGVLLRAYLQPLKYMLQEQPKEKDAPHESGSLP